MTLPARTALYPANRSRRLREALFRHPTAGYRGTPFWAWNSRLDRAQLFRQIAQFQRMGFGGFHLHARTGLQTPYLGDAFLQRVRACTVEAKRRQMLAWLYDEDRWPSGFGGGLVTEDPRHRLKYLLFTRTPYNGTVRPTPNWSCALAGRLETGSLLARYAVRLDAHGAVSYQRLADSERAPAGAETWFAYLETADGVPWYNHQGYVDTLSRAAIERFVAVTHERYRATVGGHFGKTVPAIFTDEPQHLLKECFDHATQGVDRVLPATTDFFATYQDRHGTDLLDALPELFWELPGGRPSPARVQYHDHVTERFADAYARTLGQWCERHGLLLTGHMMEEPTLGSQTRATGEAMRSLAHFQLPGIDLLCDEEEFTTAKQAQSVAHQYGRPGVMSELYGVTGWAFDFIGHKAQGDWQAALGVTVRVPHLAWVSMAGEAKRDYPASIHYQSPWWKEYPLIENHFARLNVVLTRGSPLVRIAVIHPIESFWLCYGPLAQTEAERTERERQFAALPQWLLGNLLDFDYVSEGLLPTQSDGDEPASGFAVGCMRYDVVIVPSLRTIRGTTLDRLERFAAAGGMIVFAGALPSLVDAQPSDRARRLAARAISCRWDERELVACLEPWRSVDCLDAAGRRARDLIYQLRSDDAERHLFICHRNRTSEATGLTLQLAGRWRPYARDTSSGRVEEIFAQPAGEMTRIPVELAAHGHLLLTLRPGRPQAKPVVPRRWRDIGELADPAPVTLSEQNVLLLDCAEWRWNGGAWQPREEMLRLHNRVRARCRLPAREGHVVQPWADRAPAEPLGRVELRFRITTEIPVRAPELAVEEAASCRLQLDGREVPAVPRGWWVDEAIQRVKLPSLSPGTHELRLSRTFTRKTELEWCYLLGDFGVRLAGRHATLTAPVRRLAFGDWTTQGLPFYAGNVTYHLGLRAGNRVAQAVHFPAFRAPLLSVALDRSRAKPVALAPFRFELPRLSPGRHRLGVTAFGNRHNAFGPLHHTDPQPRWLGPDAWRTEGKLWAYEYQLKPMGLLVAPRLQTADGPGSV